MKKISVNNFQSEKGKYTVCLGNGTATTFTNKEKAQQFLNETSQFLTQQLFNINKAYTLVNVFYRDCNWGYLDGKKQNNNYPEIERFCEASLRTVTNNLDLAVNRCTWTNGNYFTFIHLQNSVNELKLVLKELAPLCRQRSATDQLYTIDFYFMMLTTIESALKNYAFFGARLFKVPVHEIDYQTEYKPDFKTTKLKAI